MIKKHKNIILLLIYITVTFCLTVIFHEKWRDEAQSWLIARDLSFIDIIKQMRFEGHPPLWHFILAPFAKLGINYIIESIISWLIMCCTSILLIYKINIKFIYKVLILFSLPFIYLYPVISRSYVLIPLFLIMIAIIYPNRKNNVLKYSMLLLLLSYTHVLMLGLALSLYFSLFIETILDYKKINYKTVISFILSFLGLIILFLILKNGVQVNTHVHVKTISLDSFIHAFNDIIKYVFGEYLSKSFLRFLIYLSIGNLIVYEFFISKKNTIICLVGILFQIGINLKLYYTSEQKANLLLLIFLFLIIVNRYSIKKNILKPYRHISYLMYFVLLALCCYVGFKYSLNDIKNEYSGSLHTAQYIMKKTNKNSIFLFIDEPSISAIIPYTKNRKFYSVQRKKYISYVVWDEFSFNSLKIEDIIDDVVKKYNSRRDVYYIVSQKRENIEKLPSIEKTKKISKIYENKDTIIDEKYIIYKLNYNN